jgi:hypothetical protein
MINFINSKFVAVFFCLICFLIKFF